MNAIEYNKQKYGIIKQIKYNKQKYGIKKQIKLPVSSRLIKMKNFTLYHAHLQQEPCLVINQLPSHQSLDDRCRGSRQQRLRCESSAIDEPRCGDGLRCAGPLSNAVTSQFRVRRKGAHGGLHMWKPQRKTFI